MQATCQYEITDSDPCCLAFSPSPTDSRVLASGFANGMVRVLDNATSAMVVQYQQHTGAVTGLQFSADGTKLISGWVTGGFPSSRHAAALGSGLDGVVCIYDVLRQFQPIHMITNAKERFRPL